jgi:hypothetical protein
MKESKKTVAKRGSKSVSETTATTTAALGVAAAPPPSPEMLTTTATSLAARVSQAMALIQQAVATLDLNAPALTAQQRKRMSKLRKGGEKFIPQLAQMAQTWSVQIRTQPTAAMTSAMQTANDLQPLIQVLTGFLQEVQDTSFQAEGDSWSTASALYSVLKRMSRKDPKLSAQLAPAAEYFAFRRPDPKGPTLTKEERKKQKVDAKAVEVVATLPSAVPSTTTAPPITNGTSAPHA